MKKVFIGLILACSLAFAFENQNFLTILDNNSQTLKLQKAECASGFAYAPVWCGYSYLSANEFKLNYDSIILETIKESSQLNALLDWHFDITKRYLKRIDLVGNYKLTAEVNTVVVPITVVFYLEKKGTEETLSVNDPKHNFFGFWNAEYVFARGDLDCADFPSQEVAQAFYDTLGGLSNDPHRLDADNDGIPCEKNKSWVSSGTGGLGNANRVGFPVSLNALTFAPVSIPTTTPSATPPAPSNNGLCWVNGYRRANGTWVNGYWRKC